MATRTSRLAKLTRPAPAAAYPRQRLFKLLDQLRSSPAIWLSGPPGSGKTTLVADYTARRDIHCLWYQIDPGDSDIASSFYYLTEAAREDDAGLSLPHFQPEYLGDVQAFARTFFRELFRQHTPAIVFDNYQDRPLGNALQDIVMAAINEIPDQGYVFVQSRTDPPARFAGLRGRGRLDVVGWNELRLSRDECRNIAETRGLHLSDSDVEQLHSRTQGWVAGLVLLLRGLGHSVAPAGHHAGGASTVVFDYVAEEIFEQFDPAVRAFLLSAAYLPQITIAMAEQLEVAGDVRAMLRELTRSDFLVTVVKAEPQLIVQFHPLLREFLLARAEESGTGAAIDQRRRVAARVLAEHGHIDEAATLLIRISDWDGLITQIGAQANLLLEQGRGQTLQRWIRALPEAWRGRDPWLLYWLGAACFPYTPREARRLFADAHERFTARDPVDVQGALATLCSALEAIMYDPSDFALLDPWIDIGTRLGDRLQECQSSTVEARLTSNMFLAMALRQPQHPALPFWRERARHLALTQRDPNALMTVHAIFATLSGWMGQFERGESVLGQMRELSSLPEISPVSAAKFAQTESMFYMLAGERERCVVAMRRGIDVMERSGVQLWNDSILINGMYGALAEGDLDEARVLLRQIEARPRADRRFDVFLHAYGAAWCASLQGDAFLAHQHLKLAVRTATELGLPFFEVIAGIALAEVLCESGDLRRADVELARTLEIATRLSNRLLDFTTLMWRSSIAFGSGKETEALSLLRAGLEIGRERGLKHFLWWHPQVVARLCVRALQANIEADYVLRLIRQRRLMPATPPYQLPNWPWRFRVRGFGTFQLTGDGDSNLHAGKRASRPLELLKALVAFGGERVSQERIADALWPNVDRDYALRSLNTTLHRLRKIVGEESAVQVQSGELSLDRRLFWLDTWAFEQATAMATELAATCQSPQQAAGLVGATRLALGHYRGSLLADDRDCRWALAPRERFRTLLQRLLAAVCQSLDKCGQRDEALELHALGVQCEPLSESMNRQLVLALQQAGRRAEAIESLQRYRSILKAELGREPAAALQDLYRSLTAS